MFTHLRCIAIGISTLLAPGRPGPFLATSSGLANNTLESAFYRIGQSNDVGVSACASGESQGKRTTPNNIQYFRCAPTSFWPGMIGRRRSERCSAGGAEDRQWGLHVENRTQIASWGMLWGMGKMQWMSAWLDSGRRRGGDDFLSKSSAGKNLWPCHILS